MKTVPLIIVLFFSVFITVTYAQETQNEKLVQYSWQGNIEKVKSLFIDINHKNNKGQTALYAASCQGELEVVKFLISKGAAIDSVDLNNATPLMCAVWNKQYPTAKYLIDKGADVQHKDKWGNDVSKQLLHHLKEYGKR